MTQQSLIIRLKAVEEALEELDTLARNFSVSGVYFAEFKENVSALNESNRTLSDLRELIKEAEGQAEDVEQLIKLCSARPYPGSLSGQAWEDGCRQGYEWGTRLLGEKP